MASKKRGPGRPPKPSGEKMDDPLYIKLDADLAEALETFWKRESLPSKSEGARQLLRKGLKAEGLLR